MGNYMIYAALDTVKERCDLSAFVDRHFANFYGAQLLIAQDATKVYDVEFLYNSLYEAQFIADCDFNEIIHKYLLEHRELVVFLLNRIAQKVEQDRQKRDKHAAA